MKQVDATEAQRGIIYNFTNQVPYQTGRAVRPPIDDFSDTHGKGKLFFFSLPLDVGAGETDEDEAYKKKIAVYRIFCPDGSYAIQPAGIGNTLVPVYWLFNPNLQGAPHVPIVEKMQPFMAENALLKIQVAYITSAFDELEQLMLKYNTQDIQRSAFHFAGEIVSFLQGVRNQVSQQGQGSMMPK